MSKSSVGVGAPVPAHINGLLAYLRQPNEKANEDLALAYFRKIYDTQFTRQTEAKRADGYVAGSFVLELKGETNKWLSGLFQGLAYKNEGLDFGQIVVASKNFLAVWRVEDLPEAIREEIAQDPAAPNVIGTKYARKYSAQKHTLLKSAIWNGDDLFTPLFSSRTDVVISKINSFEQTLLKGRKVRLKLTVNNFAAMLREMKSFFDPENPIKAVRAFYSMLYAWTDASTVQISYKITDQATLGGETITDLVPAKRLRFKEFVENSYIATDANSGYDDFFSQYDVALDAVDKGFRIKHGIFFTDLYLSKFVMWLVRQHIPELGKHYLVIDPACGSGNLVTNWRSPLVLRHKVVSEIEPELLFAVEQRMKGDLWHNGKFTVVPKVAENKGLNFLNCSAADYLAQIRHCLEEKGQSTDRPIAFLCNPPYRSDDDQTTTSVAYKIDPSILDLTGQDAGSERYCCFLAQMKLICETAEASGLPGDLLLLLFTKSAWLTKRAIFQNIRREMLGSFELVSGALVDGSEFFDISGSWPVAFTVWRHKGAGAGLNPNRHVSLMDLTWLKKADLTQIPWSNSDDVELQCAKLLQDAQSKPPIELGKDRLSIREWSEKTMVDFKRGRRKSEIGQKVVGGLPTGDHRQANKKAYGELDGQHIGFMDDLTPCRVKTSNPNVPWFRLNNQFMDFRKNRCFSGPPTHWGYSASDLNSAKKLFFWYSLARTFNQRPYPMWVDSDDMWEPTIPAHLEKRVFQTVFAIAFAENECVETYFPANNPVKGLPELFVANPLSPLHSELFWSKVLWPYIEEGSQSPLVSEVIDAVNGVFVAWKGMFKGVPEIPFINKRAYSIDGHGLTRGAGFIQIRDFAVANGNELLLEKIGLVQGGLKKLKDDFFELLTAQDGLNYFGGASDTPNTLLPPDRTKFEQVLCRRLAVAGLFVQSLHAEPNFGRTKLAKLFYLADLHEGLDLQTEYHREPAGPLDQRALYNDRIGIEALALQYKMFRSERKGKMERYELSAASAALDGFARKYLGDKIHGVRAIADAFKSLTTEQSEIVATLFACWNDFLLRKHTPTDDEIVSDFLHHWHPKKSRFSKSRLIKALAWMRQNNFVPKGRGKLTSAKVVH